jgi:hypothetical protein
MSVGAPDCPVHRRTEGKNCLPNGSPTAPSCLGAIKGTPRHMEHYTKHSLNILRRLHSATTQSDNRVWDLSTVWVVNSLRRVCVLTSWLVCVCLLRFESCVCFFPSLTLVLCVVINFVRVRGSNLWRFLTNRKTTIRKKLWYSSGSLDHLKGVECNPRPLGCHNVEVGKCYTWPNHGIKSPCLLCHSFVWLVSSLEFSLNHLCYCSLVQYSL